MDFSQQLCIIRYYIKDNQIFSYKRFKNFENYLKN